MSAKRIGSVDINGHDICKRVYDKYGCSPTIPTGQSGNTIPKIVENNIARKFTPLECWRLMDFTDDEFIRAKEAKISNSQLYKQAGNSICVGVLTAIYKQLMNIYPNDFVNNIELLSLFSGIGAFESALERLAQ